jgi:hypothetical protein
MILPLVKEDHVMRFVLPVFAATALLSAASAHAMSQRPVSYASLEIPRGMETMCRANGEYHREGARVCVRSAYGPQLAVCGRVQNVLSWELSGAPCGEATPRN